MKIERYHPKYKVKLDEWTKKLNWENLPEKMIPPSAYVAITDNDDVVAFSCCYWGEGCSFARLGPSLFERRAGKQVLSEAYKKILMTIFSEARENGKDAVYFATASRFCINMCKEVGMVVAEDNTTSLIKDLSTGEEDLRFFIDE